MFLSLLHSLFHMVSQQAGTSLNEPLYTGALYGIPVYHIPKLEKQAVDFLKRTGNWNKYGML